MSLIHNAMVLDPDPGCSFAYQADSVITGAVATLVSPLFSYNAVNNELTIQSNQSSHHLGSIAPCLSSNILTRLAIEPMSLSLEGY